MIELLDNATRRRIEVVERLIEHNDWLSASEIADQLNVSQKTVSTDLHYISLEWKHFVRFENDTQKRYRAYLITTSLKQLYRSILNHSESFNLIEAIFLDPSHSIAYWKDTFNFSEATLRRIIDKINESLASKKVQFKFKPLALVSEDEMYVRLFMTRYLIEAFEPREWAIGSDTNQVVRLLYLIYDYVLPESPFMLDESLPAMFFTSMIRYSQGFYLNHTLDTIDECLFNQVSSFLKEHWESLEDIFENYPLEYSRQLVLEICTIVFPFYQKHDAKVKQQLDRAVTIISESFHAPIQSEARQELLTHLERSIIAHNSVHEDFTLLFARESSGVSNLKYYHFPYYLLSQKVLNEVDIIAQSRSKARLIDTLTMIIITQWTKLISCVENQKRRVNVLCLSRISSDHASFLRDIVANRFDSNVKVFPIFLDGRNRYEEGTTLPNFDLAISYDDIKTIPQGKLIVCDIVPSPRDFAVIIETVNTIRAYKLSEIPYLNETKDA